MPGFASSIQVTEADGAEMRAAVLIPFFAALVYAGDAMPAESAGDDEYRAAISALKQESPSAANLERLGQSYFMLGDFKKATSALEKAAKLDPSSSTIQTWLGRALGRRAESAFPLLAPGYATKAREAFVKALELDPRNPDALEDLFSFYIEAPGMVGGGIEKAAALLPRFKEYDPVGFLLSQAAIDEKNKRFDSAEANLRQAVQSAQGNAAPKDPGPLLALAQFLSSRGRYEESEKAFADAAALKPGAPRVLFAQAAADIKARRNPEQARDLLKKYIAANNLTLDDPPRWEALKLLKKAGGN